MRKSESFIPGKGKCCSPICRRDGGAGPSPRRGGGLAYFLAISMNARCQKEGTEQREMMRVSGKWHRHTLRVRYAETDQMGVVYHVHYLNWFEIGRTELIRDLGMPYRSIEAKGLLLPVLEVSAAYRQPARYDDRIAIYTRIGDFTNVRLEFAYEIRRLDETSDGAETETQPAWADSRGTSEGEEPALAGTLLASGMTRHVWTDRTLKPVRLDRVAPDVCRLLAEKG